MTTRPSGTRVDAHDAGKCPGCGKEIATSPLEAARPFVLHAQPTCADFDSRDPIEYVAWVNRRRRS